MNSKQVNETVNRLMSFMQDVKDGDLRTILSNMQKMSDYMAEKIRIYEEKYKGATGKERKGLNSTIPTANALPGKPEHSIPISCSSRKPPGRRIL